MSRTQEDVEISRTYLQDSFEDLTSLYQRIKDKGWDTPEPDRKIFKTLKDALIPIGTFRAGNVHDFSQAFVGWTVDEVDVDDLTLYGTEEKFDREVDVALQTMASIRGFFSGILEDFEKNRFAVRTYDGGYVLDSFPTFEEAEVCLREFEKMDKADKNYTEGFYEIYDMEKNEIILCKDWNPKELVTTKRVSASGGALKISITSECNALGIGVGDYVEVTIRKGLRSK